MKPGWFRGYTDARNWTPRHGLLVGTLTLCTALVGFSSFSPHGSPAGPEVPSASIPDVGAPGVPAGSAPPADAPCEEPPSTLGERINGEFRRDGDHVAELVGVRDPDTGNLYLGGNLYARDGGRYSTGDLWVVDPGDQIAALSRGARGNTTLPGSDGAAASSDAYASRAITCVAELMVHDNEARYGRADQPLSEGG